MGWYLSCRSDRTVSRVSHTDPMAFSGSIPIQVDGLQPLCLRAATDFIAEGTISVHINGTQAADLVLPRFVTSLSIFGNLTPLVDWLPDWIQSLTVTSDCIGRSLTLPPKLEKLRLAYCDYEFIESVPASLRVLEVVRCENLVSFPLLPPIMDKVRISSCLKLETLDCLSISRVDHLSLQGLDLIDSLASLPASVGTLVIEDWHELKSFTGIGEVTDRLQIYGSYSGEGLNSLPTGVRTLYLEDYDLRDEQIPATVKHLELASYRNSVILSSLPAGLESLSLRGGYYEDLVGLPEDLYRLELWELDSLDSFAGIPPFLTHLVIKEVDGPEDFPRLAYLDSVEIDRVVTVDGTEYTDGESYLTDSKSRAKSARF